MNSVRCGTSVYERVRWSHNTRAGLTLGKPGNALFRVGHDSKRFQRLSMQTMLPASKRDSFQDDSPVAPLLNRSQDATSEPATSIDVVQSRDAATLEPQKSPNSSWQAVVALCTLSVVVCYADRTNISTAVLPMAEQFGWDKTFQGFVLSAFFFGYALTQVLGGQLADRWGGKPVLAGGVVLWSLFTFLTPLAAASSSAGLIVSRIMLGVGEGVAFPSIHSIISRNVPVSYQSSAVGLVTTASYVGTAMAFGISPAIITHLGWPYVFYLFAGMALLWLPLWLPLQVKRDQLEYLEDGWSAGDVEVEVVPGPAAPAPVTPHDATDDSAATPTGLNGLLDPGFIALTRRKEVWAICVAQYCQSWGFYGLLNWLPTFFADQYHVELADLGSYTLLPYIVQGGVGLAAGVLADRLIAGGRSVRSVRVGLQVVGMMGPAGCLLLAVSPLVGGDPAVASHMITLGLGLSALTLGGVSASQLDIAPRHAGMVFGAGNTAATLAGLVAVPLTGILLQATDSWPLVFGITAGHYLVGSVIWSLWAGDRPLPEDQLGAAAPSAPAH